MNNESKAAAIEMEKNIYIAQLSAKKQVKKMPRPTPVNVLNVEDLKKLYFECSNVTLDSQEQCQQIVKYESDMQKVTNLCNNLRGPSNIHSNNIQIGSFSPSDNKRMFCFPHRRSRKRLYMCTIGTLCFVAGIAIALIVRNYCFSNAINSSLVKGGLMKSARKSNILSDYKLDAVLKDLFISVKTTKKFHHPRLVILLETWVTLVKSQTWFFTDEIDEDMSARSSDHLIVTNCSTSHSRTALACKMAAEFDAFLRSHKSWWCHFDDDNYVHVTRLAQLLKAHDPSQPVYLGKPSTAKPLEVFDLKSPENVSHFWFATGGAGFCISRTLALKMAPFAANGKFVETGDKFWFPDDVTLGYIVEHLLGEHLTVVPEFHSHLEPMRRINVANIDDQISFSYISYNGVDNVLDLPGPLPTDADPTRFYSLHCRLYNASYCPEEVLVDN